MASACAELQQCVFLGGARRAKGGADSAATIAALIETMSKLGKSVDPGDSIHETAHKLYNELKSFDVKQKDYSKICESARIVINKIIGSEVIRPSTDPVQLINNINDHLRALKEKHCGDFDVIKKDVETSVSNLQVLLEMIQNAYDSAIANTTSSDRSVLEATRPVIDHIRQEANRQISLLAEFLKVPVKSVEATVLAMRSESPPDIIKRISKGSMSDRLSSILVGLGETGLLKVRMESALETLGLRIGENSKSLSEAFLDKLEALRASGALTDESVHKIAHAYKILEPLTEDGKIIKLSIGGFSIEPALKKEAMAKTGGKSLKSVNKQIQEKSVDYASALHAFRAAMNIYYDKLTFTIDQIAMHILRESPKLTDDIEKFKVALEKLVHLQAPTVFQALSGLHDDTDSLAVRDRFINYMRIVAERAILLKSTSELYGDISLIIGDMIGRIGQYSAIKPFVGGAEPDDAVILGAAETAQLKVGGRELFVPNVKQDKTRFWKLSDAIQKYVYYIGVQRVERSMDFAESDIDQYNADYSNLVGIAVAKVLNDAQTDLKQTTDLVDALTDAELDELMFSAVGDPDYTPERSGLKEAVKKYHRRRYKKLVRTYKFAQRIDTYLMKFTDSAIKNRNLLENVFTSLEATNYIANWMNESSGNDLVHFAENFPAHTGGTVIPPMDAVRAPLQAKGRYRTADADKFPSIDHHYYAELYKDRIGDAAQRTMGDVTRPVAYRDVPAVIDAIKKAKNKTKAGKNLIQLFFKIGNTISPNKDGGFSVGDEQEVTAMGGFDDDGEALGEYATGGAKFTISPEERAKKLSVLKLGAVFWRVCHLDRNIHEHGACSTYPAPTAADPAKIDEYTIEEIHDLGMTLHTYTMNAIAGKIFAAIGLYNRTQNYNKTHGAADVITQTIFGRGQTVEVLPEVSELYLRLPLLAEFYRDILGFDVRSEYNAALGSTATGINNGDPAFNAPRRPSNLPDHKITMVPDIDGTYAGIIRVIFSRQSQSDISPYSDNQIRDLISNINGIYAKYKNDGSADPIGDAFRGLVREINRRIMIIKWSDVERYQKHKREYISAQVGKENDSVDYDADFPKVNKKHMVVASDRFTEFSRLQKDQLPMHDKMKIFKAFRAQLLRKLGGVDPTQYASFNTLLVEFRNKMGLAKDNTMRFNEVLSLMGGLDRGANIDVVKLMMFRECVIAPVELLKFIYGQCKRFIDMVAMLDISEIDNDGRSRVKMYEFIHKFHATHTNYRARYLQDWGGPVRGAAQVSTCETVDPTPGGIAPLGDVPVTNAIRLDMLFYDLVNSIYQFGGDSNGLVNISIEENRHSCRLVLQFGKLQDAVATVIRGVEASITSFVEQIPHEQITKYVGGSDKPGSLAFLRQNLLDEILSDTYPRDSVPTIRSLSDAILTVNKIFDILAKPWSLVCYQPVGQTRPANAPSCRPQLGDAFAALVYDNQPEYRLRNDADTMQVQAHDRVEYVGYPKYYADKFTGAVYNCNQIVSYLLDSIGDNKPYTPLISALADNAVFAKKAIGNIYAMDDAVYYGQADEVVYASNAMKIHRYLETGDGGKYKQSESDMSRLGAYIKDTLTTTLPVVWRMSAELTKKCDLLKDLTRYGQFNLSGHLYRSEMHDTLTVANIKRVYGILQAGQIPAAELAKLLCAVLAVYCIIQRQFRDPAICQACVGGPFAGQNSIADYCTSLIGVGLVPIAGIPPDMWAAAGLLGGVPIITPAQQARIIALAAQLYASFRGDAKSDDEFYAKITNGELPITAYCKFDFPETDWQNEDQSTNMEKYVVTKLNSVADVLYRIATACNETLTAIGENMMFGDHKANFLVNYRAATTKIPVSPVSWVLTGLRYVDPEYKKIYLLPNESPTSDEYKYNRALRSILSPGISMTLDRCPYNEALYAEYDLGTDKINKIDKSQYADLMMGVVSLAQYALFQRVYRSSFNTRPTQYVMYADRATLQSPAGAPVPDNAPLLKLQYLGNLLAGNVILDTSADYKMYKDWHLHKQKDMPPELDDLFDYAENHNQHKSLYYLTKTKITSSQPDRNKLRVYNILDMGVAPINLNVLRREIPFVNIYNYHLGFVDMMHEFLDIGKSAHYDLELENTRLAQMGAPAPAFRRTSIRYNDTKMPHRILYKLVQDPYASLSVDEYNHLGLFIKGSTDLPRPQYISDQMWNKCLLNRINDIRIPIEADGAALMPYQQANRLAGIMPVAGTNGYALARVVIPTPPSDNVHTYVNNNVLSAVVRNALRPLYMTYLTDEAYTGGDDIDVLPTHRKTRTAGLLFLANGVIYTNLTALGNRFGQSDPLVVEKCINVGVGEDMNCRNMVGEFARLGKDRFDLTMMRKVFHKTLLHYFVLQKLARELFSNVSPVTRGIYTVAPARLGYNAPGDAWRDINNRSEIIHGRRVAEDSDDATGRYSVSSRNPAMR